MRRKFRYTHPTAENQWLLSGVETTREAMDLSVFLTQRMGGWEHDIEALYQALHGHVEDVDLEDEAGPFSYSSLTDGEQLELLMGYFPDAFHIKDMINSILDGSQIAPSIAKEVQRRFEIQYEDQCECPICTPNTNGKYAKNTKENRDKWGCLINDIGPDAMRICYYVSVLETSDMMDAPYWLFDALTLKKSVEMIALGKRQKERKVEEKRREIEEQKRKAKQERYGSGVPKAQLRQIPYKNRRRR